MQIGRWRASYTPGPWLVLAGPAALVVLPPARPQHSELLATMWVDVLAAADIHDLTARLAEYNADSLPHFGAFFFVGDEMRSLVRGAVQVRDDATGEVVADGTGVVTWREDGLGSLERVRVELVEVTPGSVLELPLVVGAVTVSTLVLDRSAVVDSPQGELLAEAVEVEPASDADPDGDADADEPSPVAAGAVAAVGAEAVAVEEQVDVPGVDAAAAPIPAEEPVAEVPAVEEPAVEEPASEQPVVEEPVPAPEPDQQWDPVPEPGAGADLADPEPADPAPAEETPAVEAPVEPPAEDPIPGPVPVTPPIPDPVPAVPAGLVPPAPGMGVPAPPVPAAPSSAEDDLDSSTEAMSKPWRRKLEVPAESPFEPRDDDGDTELAPGPGPRRSVPTTPSQPSVFAYLCPQQHSNPVGNQWCRVCGAPVPSQQPQWVPRPVLAQLRPSTGATVPVDRLLLVGRAPSPPPALRDQVFALVTVPSPSQDISRTHLQVEPKDWGLAVTDLHSTNGTTVVRPGREPERVRLTPGEPMDLEPGWMIDLGDGVSVVVERA